MNKNSSQNDQDLDKMREDLHRSMFSEVSHDLKTPLSTVIGSLEILTGMRDKLSDEKQLLLIKSALSEAYRLDHFINNILDMAKLENDSIIPNFEKCDLDTILQNTIKRLGPKIENGDIRICIPNPELNIIYTDPMLLSRAIGALIDNAIKHGAEKPIVNIDYSSDGHSGYIHVKDNGPGIPQEQLNKIFFKYARFSQNGQNNATMGLGLTICQKIMTILSGKVEFKVSSSTGTEFVLQFPIKNEII